MQGQAVGAMGELDSKTWFDEAQTYQRVRRLALLFNFAYIASFVGFVICFFSALAHNWDALAAVLFLLYIPIASILGLVTLITSLDLRGFRCPRCGNRFAQKLWSGWPTNHCKHCWLYLGPTAVAPAKSPGNLDLWE
jgi:hypothetical protein